MISLLPAHHETLVLPKSSVEVYHILERATSHKTFIQSEEQKLFFNGWVKESRFRLSLRQHRFNNYLPIVMGQIESTSTGCIVFIDYKLFPATRLFVTLWTILIVIGTLVAWFQTTNIWYLPGGGVILTIIHLIVWSNFRLQLKPTRTTIQDLLA